MKFIHTSLFLLLALGTSAASAALTVANLSDFSGTETVIDFDTISNESAINTQYSSSGVTFDGLLGMTNPGDTDYFNDTTIASNWNYSEYSILANTWTASFSSLQYIVGFFSETNYNDDVSIEAFSGVTSLGIMSFANSDGAEVNFLGIQSLLGFDSILVSILNQKNGFFAMDDFRFGQSDTLPSAVPLPAAAFLFAPALLGFMGLRRKTKNTIA